MSRKKVLVTGAAGRIGQVMRAGLKDRYDVRLMYHRTILEAGAGEEGGSGAEVYADDELPATIYPKFEQIYRGGILAELQRRVPLARDVQEAVRPGAAAHFRRPGARLYNHSLCSMPRLPMAGSRLMRSRRSTAAAAAAALCG